MCNIDWTNFGPIPRQPCAMATPDPPHDLLPDGDSPLRLNDMPSSWLLLLLEALDPQARLSLFSACSALRDLVLCQWPARLAFGVPFPEERTLAGCQQALQLACLHSTSVTLVLQPNGVQPGALGEEDVSVRDFMARAVEEAGHALTAITSVELTGLVLDALVPSWLTTTCPNMTRLKLLECRLSSLTPTTDTIPLCSHLKELVMDKPPAIVPRTTPDGLSKVASGGGAGVQGGSHAQGLQGGQGGPGGVQGPGFQFQAVQGAGFQFLGQGFQGPGFQFLGQGGAQGPGFLFQGVQGPAGPGQALIQGSAVGQQPVAVSEVVLRWRQQLLALPGLRSLTVHHGVTASYLESCSEVGPQITHLRIPFLHFSLHVPEITRCFPSLTELHVPWLPIDDVGMELLLGTPTLRVLGCFGFHIKERYTERECWLTDLSFSVLDVRAFDRLPLGRVKSLKAHRGREFKVLSGADLGACERVVRAVESCGGVEWGTHVWVDSDVRKCCVNGVCAAASACLMAILPILSTSKAETLTLQCVHITPGVLTAIRLTPSSPPRLCIALISCAISPDLWPVLLPSLPPVLLLVLECPVGATDEHMAQMCAGANRPITVTVRCSISQLQEWQEGWRGRARAAMAEAGHQHVTLI